MWLCNVVDTSVAEDKEYLEFWYADAVYAIRATVYMYEVQKISFKYWLDDKNWLDENTRCDCIYVPKPTEEDQL